MGPLLSVPLLSAAIAALVSASLLVGFSLWQRNREKKALLLAYATELVEAFRRTVMYYQQHSEGQLSYLALYEATDATTLGKLASVVDNPDIIYAVVRLKERYTQIQQDVLEASKSAAESSVQAAESKFTRETQWVTGETVLEPDDELEDSLLRVEHAQSKALAFFDEETFDSMVRWTETFIGYTKKSVRGRLLSDLERKLNQSIADKRKIDREVYKTLVETYKELLAIKSGLP